jgi:hypothetical protein
MSRLTNSASVGTMSPELEEANNEARATIFIGHEVHLPLIAKGF